MHVVTPGSASILAGAIGWPHRLQALVCGASGVVFIGTSGETISDPQRARTLSGPINHTSANLAP
jgi:hypothetical protein